MESSNVKLDAEDRDMFKKVFDHVQANKKIPQHLYDNIRDIIEKFPESEKRTKASRELEEYMEDHKDDEDDGDDELQDEPTKKDWSSALIVACMALVAAYSLRIFDKTEEEIELQVNSSGLKIKKGRKKNDQWTCPLKETWFIYIFFLK